MSQQTKRYTAIMSLRQVRIFEDPAEAEAEVDAYYESLTPQQRLDEMVRLCNEWGKWNERRLERVATVIDLTRS
jgi:hypothetical protein